MPLSAQLPVIDNRTFDDIVAEAQTRIPRYTQEWTDFNAGDAGFALIELFAWMTELLIFRLGQVPQLNYIKFLQLIGIELNPAQPAQTVLVFPVQSGFAQSSVPVSAGTQVSAAPANGGSPIVFETETAIIALQAPMDAVLAFDGAYYTDVTADNDPGAGGFQPFGPLAPAGSALLLGFNQKLPFPGGLAVSLGFWPATNRGVPAPSPCGGGASPLYAPAQIVWEYWAGTAWLPLKILSDSDARLHAPGLRAGDAAGGRNDRAVDHAGQGRRQARVASCALGGDFLRTVPDALPRQGERGRRARRADRAERGRRR